MKDRDLTFTELVAQVVLTLARIQKSKRGGNIEIHCKGNGYIIKSTGDEQKGRIIE